MGEVGGILSALFYVLAVKFGTVLFNTESGGFEYSVVCQLQYNVWLCAFKILQIKDISGCRKLL